MTVAWADVLLVAPELDATGSFFHGNSSAQNAVLADALALVAPDSTSGDIAPRWGSVARSDMATKYLCAHMATVIMRGALGPSGAVIGESVGGISRQYANNSPAGTNWIYSTTPYGRAYQGLLQMMPGRVGIVC